MGTGIILRKGGAASVEITGQRTLSGIYQEDISKFDTVVGIGNLVSTDILTTMPELSGSIDAHFSTDGLYLAITKDNSPYIDIYKRDGDTFTKLPGVDISPPAQGTFVRFSATGNYLAVAHFNSPFFSVYKRNGDTFTKLESPDTLPGILPGNTANSLAFGLDDSYLAVAYTQDSTVAERIFIVYKRNGDTFIKLPDPTFFPIGLSGENIAFSSDANYLVLGHGENPYLTIYRRVIDSFIKIEGPDTVIPNKSSQVVFSPDDNYLAVSHYSSPYMAVYKRNGDNFIKINNPDILPPSDATAIGFSADNNYLAVGHFQSPYLTIYKLNEDVLTKILSPQGLIYPANFTEFGAYGNYLIARDTMYKNTYANF
jgi:WD40 repeat protein